MRRLTVRDRKFLASLAASRWLTTTQAAALSFPGVSLGVVQRCLRRLRNTHYIVSLRPNRMADALHTLGVRGRAFLRSHGWERPIRLERTPPVQIEHFLGINDIRIAVERSAERDGVAVDFFFASWELAEHGWPYRLIPDAACSARFGGETRTALFEYDRGTERPAYLVRHKLRRYDRGFDGLPFSFVLLVVDTVERLELLRERTSRVFHEATFLFTLRQTLLSSCSLKEWF